MKTRRPEDQKGRRSINLIIVECKYEEMDEVLEAIGTINLIIVECKYITKVVLCCFVCAINLIIVECKSS